jgi:para-aminobenzoate synthetase
MAPYVPQRRAKILFLDAYDSFSNNIIAQVEQCVDAEVIPISIDNPAFRHRVDSSTILGLNAEERTLPEFAKFLQSFDAVIAGPGPGSADRDQDVGLIRELWKLQESEIIPVLGVCLGFQSLALAFGGNIQRLQEPRHGLVSEILHKEQSIFSGTGQLLATQYHSLQVDIGHPIQTKRTVSYPGELWAPTEQCPELEPLAWDFDNRTNGAVLMAVKHIQKPFWGVQFHPESICTNSESSRVIQNWWTSVQSWNRKRWYNNKTRPQSLAAPSGDHVTNARNLPNLAKCLARQASEDFNSSMQSAEREQAMELTKINNFISTIKHGDLKSFSGLSVDEVHCTTIGSGRLTVADICDIFDIPRNEAIVLESGLQADLLPSKVGTGRYSIIGLIIPGESIRIHYNLGTRRLILLGGNDRVIFESVVLDPWIYLKAMMKILRPQQPPTGLTFAPFWGGLMGYASYEAGLDTIDVQPRTNSSQPDICFAYITRSIVIDHQVKKIYVQSIRDSDDMTWVNCAREKIYQAAYLKSQTSTPITTPMGKPNPFDTDAILNGYLSSCKHSVASRTEYCQSVANCQEIIASGHSYELCFTSQNKIKARKPKICQRSQADSNEMSWKLYKRLTKQNPAPFSAYIRLGNVHVLSSSPERYISWDRNQSAQCRPIKGTVQKRPGVTPADAHAILSSSKERAENLMIVDLVRHQLHGVYGSGNVHVSQLMEVEEYETLWQLVSVVDGVPSSLQKARTPDEWEDPVDYVSSKNSSAEGVEFLGFDAFVESLPPGSMTGAPKKRSCEILQKAENHEPRGIYAGVLGYLDVGGGGDFSVVIRTAVKIDDEDPESKEDVWHIGAGGAITAQSTPEGEYEEMRAKFMSTSRAFRLSPAPELKSEEKDVKSSLEELTALLRGDIEGLNVPALRTLLGGTDIEI